MRMARRACAGLGLLVAVLTASCGGSTKPASVVTPGVASSSQVAEPTATPIDPISTGDTCPISEISLCGAALELRTAARANDIAFITERLAPSFGHCADQQEIGCQPESSGSPSPPVVAWFNYSSDCCYISVDGFRGQLTRLLPRAKAGTSDRVGAGAWNLLGVLTGGSFWQSKMAVILTALLDDNQRWVIEIGIDPSGGQWKILGAIQGPVGAYYKFPEAELHRW